MDEQAARRASKEFWDIWQDLTLAYEAYARKLGVSYPELLVLEEVYEGPRTQTQIARATMMPKQTVNSIVSSLAAAGTVKLAPSESDRRAKLVELTEEGRELACRVVEPEAEAEVAVFGQLGEEECGRVLGKMRELASYYRERVLGVAGMGDGAR